MSDWLDLIPSKSNGSDSSLLAIKDFLGMSQKCVSLYSDNSKELVATARKAKMLSNTATPYRPQSNGKGERTVGLCIEGGRTVLHQSGLAHAFWSRQAAPPPLKAFTQAKQT